ncbi:MAG TPA: ribosome maturation factor RimP [Streptosporangiaceae bacterium]|nr:ribosome maturation factor RimP [Streptosporangiaceae bacterium]
MRGGPRHVPARTGRAAGRGPARKPGKAPPADTPARPDRPPGPAPDTDQVIRVATPVVHALGMDLESVKVTSAGRRRLLRIVVDGDHGVSLDDAALASREISAKLDGSNVMGDMPYTLEVSSPGVDRPLTQPRHWQRAVGRLVRVPVSESPSDPVQGRVLDADATEVVLDVNGARRRFAYAALGAGKIQIEFDRSGQPGQEPDTGEPDGH